MDNFNEGKLHKVGNSAFVLIPAEFLHENNLKIGDILNREIEGNRIILEVKHDRH